VRRSCTGRTDVPETRQEDLDILHVSGFDDDLVVQLPVTQDTILPGNYGLMFDSGRGLAQVGEILEYDPASQTVARRIVRVMAGDLRTARRGRWTGTVFTHPSQLELPYEDIVLTSDVGDLPAWFLPTTAEEPLDTWAILVHGRGSTRAEVLRAGRV